MYQYADYLHIISVLLEDYAKESLLDTQNIYIQRVSQPYPKHQAFIFDKKGMVAQLLAL